ncbi:MAG: iron ABC transporter permease [Pseudomonadota bacterium]
MSRGLVWAPAFLLLCLGALLYGARGAADLRDLTALFGGPLPGDADAIVLVQLRLPRLLAALVAGGALGAAGAIIQTLSRNPLADPGLLGVNSGAAFAIVLTFWAFGPQPPAALALPGLLGASLAAGFVWILAMRVSHPMTLILGGVALTAVLGAGVRALILADSVALDGFRQWAVGSVAVVEAPTLALASAIGAAGLCLALLSARSLDALSLGDDMARALGASLIGTRAAALAATALLSTAAVLVAGPLMFIGLVAPHIARMTGAQSSLGLLGASCAWGASLVIAADLIGRSLFPGVVIQAGLGVALVGGPLLIWLVCRDVRDGV